MANRTLNTRIQLKCDTEANWSKALNFIPKKGEAIIYSADSAHPFSRLKVGDGNSYINELPFIDASTIEGKSILIDTTSNWNSQINFIPKRGDLIFYADKTINSDGINIPGLKIGDGLAYCIDLPFIGDDISASLESHITNDMIHITTADRTKWNNKINCEDVVVDEILILNRN